MKSNLATVLLVGDTALAAVILFSLQAEFAFFSLFIIGLVFIFAHDYTRKIPLKAAPKSTPTNPATPSTERLPLAG